ncbi:MAG TPA: DinB family protein [Actinomycetota bacterium]
MPAETVDRSWPQTWARDETQLQRQFLQFLRATVVNKIAGLSRADAAATPIPTSPALSLMGIVKHLTSVERFWISIVAGGEDVPDPWADVDADDDFRLSKDDSPASVVAAYRDEWARADAAIAGMSPDEETRKAVGGKRRTVRWIYAHLVQETARHVGHMDLLREMADGAVGE